MGRQKGWGHEHLGALLIHPTRIINVAPVDDTDFYTMVAA